MCALYLHSSGRILIGTESQVKYSCVFQSCLINLSKHSTRLSVLCVKTIIKRECLRMFPFLFANYFLEDFCAGLLFMITRLCRRIRILIGTANYISDMRTVPGDQDHRQRCCQEHFIRHTFIWYNEIIVISLL